MTPARVGACAVLALGVFGAAACDGCAPLPSGWTLLREAEPGALLSVRAKDGVVWVSGGDPDGTDDPATATLLVDDDPYDDQDFVNLDTGLQGDLWWVAPASATVAYVGGAFGRVARVDRGTAPPTITELTTPATAANDEDIIVFGVYVAAPDDIWAVGGRLGGATGGFVWRAQGEDGNAPDTFVDVPLPTTVENYAVWKMEGRGPNDLWFVGTAGLSFHYDGTTLRERPTGFNTSLFTVAVNDDGALAVGGLGRGLVLSRGRDDDAPWQDVSPDGDATPTLLGVHLNGSTGLAVGNAGVAYAIDDGVFTRERFGFPMLQSLHSCFVDDDGLVWAVGGRLTGLPLTQGVLLRRAP